MVFAFRLFGVAFLTFVGLTSAAKAAGEFMTVSGQTSQPIGHYEFCERLPQECKIRNTILQPVKLTQNVWDMMLDVNHSVNARITPATDMELYGREEYWTYPVNAGDCEDYVLEKQKELHDKGMPLASLLITVVRKPDGEGHAVLTVRTDRGDFVLDNLRDEVFNWKDTEYTYLKRQSTQSPGKWVSIEQRDDIVVSSVNNTGN
ncbi:Transglutaminase-like cysteine peptidase [Bartonella apihabitans]|uniref:transglutaminase-like cysteine peptidase n=1 Tax=Bartonella apihabitans TaxID=2750929 RepID=UPI00098E9FB3|nr:transglutaminase-like cysteine peptidase [Bartonella apihabitans]AQT43992.1 putative transglutaminase-like cysteine proteinase [Bartonella apihabitans]